MPAVESIAKTKERKDICTNVEALRHVPSNVRQDLRLQARLHRDNSPHVVKSGPTPERDKCHAR
eukprot:5607265-Prorocentrum_lima.AAC.1